MWQFRNLDNGYSVRMLLGEESVGLRFGAGPRGLSDLAKGLFGGTVGSASETSLRSVFTVLVPFAASELLMARLLRRSRGVTALYAVNSDRYLVRPLRRDREILEFESMAFSLTPAVDLNAWSSGEGRLYFPV